MMVKMFTCELCRINFDGTCRYIKHLQKWHSCKQCNHESGNTCAKYPEYPSNAVLPCLAFTARVVGG